MSQDVVIVDYGRGNLFSVRRAFEHVGANVVLTDDPASIADAPRLVLPGVGAFGDAMAELSRRKLVEPLRAYAVGGRPMLGICVGMQILFEHGEEFGEHAGLGVLPGRVQAIPDRDTDGRALKIPHIGWNRLRPARDWSDTIFADIDEGTYCYFVHSFAAQPGNADDCLADTVYGSASLAAAVNRDMLWGCQFHPEKSGPAGLRILSKFMTLAPRS